MRVALPLAFLLLSVACKESAVKITGDHSTPASALPTEVDKNLAGEFNGAEQNIFLRVNLKEPAMLRAELSPARGVDSALAVFNPPQKLLFDTDDNGSSLGEEIPPVYLPAGESLIRLRGRGGDHSPFTFFYRTFNAPSDIEREPNNTIETATPVSGMRATGFYGPELDRSSEVREREKDCFLKELTASEKKTVAFKLTGVDGILSSIVIRDAAGKEILRQEAPATGSPLTTGPIAVAGNRFFVCVAAVSTLQKRSRDYYDLTMSFGEATQKTEIEPNNSPGTATVIHDDNMDGVISALNDSDYFSYTNRRDYPVSLRVDLETPVQGVLALQSAKLGQSAQLFEDSAPRGEIAENIRLEAGEAVILVVRNRLKLKKNAFKVTAYTIQLQETQVSDENETEPNATPEKADGLVDLTQKWGFINPIGDVDFYRMKLSAAGERVVSFESKIDCKIRLEHLRGAKSIAVTNAPQNVRYQAVFEKDDLVKVQCLGQKPAPRERAYRIAVSEP